jgi:hypothetical protein
MLRDLWLSVLFFSVVVAARFIPTDVAIPIVVSASALVLCVSIAIAIRWARSLMRNEVTVEVELFRPPLSSLSAGDR